MCAEAQEEEVAPHLEAGDPCGCGLVVFAKVFAVADL
jgi:hypothetical protein